MHDTALIDAHLATLPIFPLGGAVLFPHATMPLHVFEPRYRQMTAHALEQDRPIAIAMLAPDEAPGVRGRPAVRPVAGVGFIEGSERLPDGRYLITLVGRWRARIVAEGPQPEGQLYRSVQAELVEDAPAGDGARAAQAAEALQTLQGLVGGLGQLSPRIAEYVLPRIAAAEDVAEASFSAAQVLVQDPAVRQRLLESTDVVERLCRLNAHVTDVIAAVAAKRGEIPKD